MAVLTQIPNAPVVYDDLRDTLNANGGSTNNEHKSFFVADANVNSNARYKPVRLAQDVTDNQPNWYKAYNGLCGFNLANASASSWDALRECYGRANNGWVYELPQGGSSQPMRISDFRGYHPKAKPLSYGLVAPNVVYKTQTYASISLNISANDGYSLTWNDFDTLKNYYFGVYIYSAGHVMRMTSASTLANGGSLIEFSPSMLQVRAYKIYPFISSVKYIYTESDKVMTLYSLPKIAPIDLEVKSSVIIITLTATRDSRSQTISYSVIVKNNNSSAVTLSNNRLRIYRTSISQESIGDYIATIATKSVAAGATVEIASGVATLGYRDGQDGFDFDTTPLTIFVSLGNGAYTASSMVG